MKTKANKKRRIILLAIPALLILSLCLYMADYYRAGEAARAALLSDDVLVEETDFGWFFDGPAADAALIFYPGAKVEETAYAPLLHRLARSGPDVFLLRMPLHIALLGTERAQAVMERYDYARWYVGGHSLGGLAAADFAAEHAVAGVVLLAAYPTKPLEEPMLLICGTEDGVINRERMAKAQSLGTVEELTIPGGNHADFGDYGAQRRDNAALIPPERQQRETAEAGAAWIARSESAGAA